MKYLLVALMFLSALACGSNHDQYQLACEVFNEARDNSIQLDAGVVLEKLEKKAGKKSDVYVAWEALVNFKAEERYNIYKMTVEEITGVEWHCESMKLLAHTW